MRLLRGVKSHNYSERKYAGTIDTVQVPWPFPMLIYEYIFLIKYTEAILSNSTRKLLWFEISKNVDGSLKK